MVEQLRNSGIKIIDKLKWGAHLCQFYKTKEDLIDILVPYFHAGLENNEFCMWITSEPLTAQEATKALTKKIKNINDYIKKGQIEILDYSQWYTKTDTFDKGKVLQGWVEKENQALARGFDGLRVTGNTFWLEGRTNWKDFTEYEAAVNSLIGKYHIIAICSYHLQKCDASKILEVMKNHHLALLRKDDTWGLIENECNTLLTEANEALQISHRFLEIANRHTVMTPLLKEFVLEIKKFTDCDAVGLRILNEEGNIPYQAYEGFSQKFYNSENPLSISADQCMCIDVIKGKTDPKQSVFTEGGSFFINGTTRFLRALSEDERRKTRNVCNEAGYEFVGLVPIRAGKHILGLIHVADHRENIISLKKILALEDIARQLGLAIQRVWAEETLRGSEKKYRAQLKQVVKERTSELAAANEQLHQEIKKQKKTEKALRESENRYRSFVQNFPGIAYQGLNFVPLFFHGAVEEITGYTEQEFIHGKPRWDQIVHRDDLFIVYGKYGKAKRKILKVPHHAEKREYRIIRKDGQIRWIHENIQNLCDDTGKPILVQGVIYDISNEKQAKDNLIQSEKKYRALMNNAGDAILVADKNGNLIDANKKAEKLFGYTRKEFLTMNVAQMPPKEHVKGAVAKFKEVIQKGFGLYIDGLIQKKDGTVVPIDLTGSAIEYEGKKVFQAIFRDITERKKMEGEIQKIEKLKAVGVLAGGIAHDFNNILTGIMGNLSLAQLFTKSGESIFEAIQRALEASKHASQLTQQLLTFSKGGAPIKKTSSITELIKDTTTFVLRGSQLKYESSFPEDLWSVKIDKGQISQVITNLVINAKQAMPDSGTIRIGAENVTIEINSDMPLKEGKYVKVILKDQGVGIAQDHLHKIFDPYFTTKHEGSGLGLATCHSIMSKHNGYITVESETGMGTTFYLYLPASEKKAIKIKKISEEAPYAGHGKILLMDDDQDVIDAAREILIHLGYTLEIARNGAEAIELYKKAHAAGEPFDAAVLDLTIPGDMGGKAALKKLLKIDPHVKAIVSSGYANASIMAGYERYGFEGVIAKPYEVKELSKVLHKVINSKKEPPLTMQ